MKVYLAGGMFGLTDAECKDWRDEATRELGKVGIIVLNPMRRDYRGSEIENIDLIVPDDLDDINEADALLVDARRASWGTAMELFYARYQRGIKAFIWGAPVPISPWLAYHATKQAKTLQEAINAIVEWKQKTGR